MLRSPPDNKEKSASTSDLDICTSHDTTLQPKLITRDKRRRTSSKEYDELTAFKIEVREMLQSFLKSQSTRLDTLEKHISEIKTHVSVTHTEINKSLNTLSDKLNHLELKLESFEEQRQSITSQIVLVDEKLENFGKNCKKTSIEIRNVPKQVNETKEALFGYIQALTSTIKIELPTGDIRDVYRLPSKADKTSSTIVAEFNNSLTRSKILAATRTYYKSNAGNQLYSTHLNLPGDPTRIYISESLTYNTRRLYFLAKDLARSQDFKFCWISNGNVLLRKQEDSPYIIVKNEKIISDLKQ